MLPLPSTSVIFQRTEDGAVLFSPTTEVYFGLNEVGARIWELLPPVSESLESLCEALGKEHPTVDAGTIRADVVDLLAQLTAEGLVSSPAGGMDARPAT